MAETSGNELAMLLKDFENVMMITKVNDASVHARPMRIADIANDGGLYFATSVQSPKVSEIVGDAAVSLIFQCTTKFAALHGVARVVRDKELLDRLWSESWRAWFPGGKNDPLLVLIKVEPHEAEFWDNTGLQGLSYAFNGAKAYIRGEKPETTPDAHVRLIM
jgi:general stress protein 26